MIRAGAANSSLCSTHEKHCLNCSLEIMRTGQIIHFIIMFDRNTKHKPNAPEIPIRHNFITVNAYSFLKGTEYARYF
jgi:hypothetical protein